MATGTAPIRFPGHDAGRRETEHDEREKERVECENTGQYNEVHQVFERWPNERQGAQEYVEYPPKPELLGGRIAERGRQ